MVPSVRKAKLQYCAHPTAMYPSNTHSVYSSSTPKPSSPSHAVLQILHFHNFRRIDLLTRGHLRQHETSYPTRSTQPLQHVPGSRTYPLKHQLRHPLPLFHPILRLPMIEQQHLDLTPVICIDHPSPGIDEVLRREARPRRYSSICKQYKCGQYGFPTLRRS